jgi:hypothetical protein
MNRTSTSCVIVRCLPDARLPIKIKRIPGGYTVDLADSRKLWIYRREPEVARAANAMTLEQAEELAKDVARAPT